MYQNVQLKELIVAEKNGILNLNGKTLTAQDAEIVAYYALFINKVSRIKSIELKLRTNGTYVSESLWRAR